MRMLQATKFEESRAAALDLFFARALLATKGGSSVAASNRPPPISFRCSSSKNLILWCAPSDLQYHAINSCWLHVITSAPRGKIF